MCSRFANHRPRIRLLDFVRSVGVAVLMVVAMSGLAPLVAHAADSSLAGDHAEVIAQGVTTLTGDRLAWRVVSDMTDPSGTGNFPQRALGFSLATDSTFLQTDQATGERTLMQPGEAAFVQGGASQSRESLDSNPADYVRIGLVAEADASNGEGADVTYAGSGFDVTAGDYDIELAAVALDANQTTNLATSGTSLVYVVDGSADLGSETLDAGEAIEVEGPIQITARDASVRVYVATIGASIAAGAAPVQPTVASGQPTEIAAGGGTASIVIATELCPAGVTLKQVQATQTDKCAGGGPVSNMTVQITESASGTSQQLDIDPSNGEALFQDLTPGDYTVAFLLPDGYSVALGVCGGQDSSADLPVITTVTSSTDLNVPADRQYLCEIQVLQPDASVDESGSLSAEFFACPAGMTFDDLDTGQCGLITDGFDFGFQADSDLHLADAQSDSGEFIWSGLTLSPDEFSGVAYSPIVYTLPDGYDAYAIATDGGAPALPAAGGYILTSDQPSFSLQVFFFSS